MTAASPHPGTEGPQAAGPDITVIGIADDRVDLLLPEALAALADADVLIGSRHHLWLWQSWGGRTVLPPARPVPETVEVGNDPAEAARAAGRAAAGPPRRICVLAGGDPGFFGVVGALVTMVDRHALRVHPAPSPVALAFARLGLPWDDALVVPAHGRHPSELAGMLRTAPKVAYLASPDVLPEAIGRALLDAGAAMDLVAVCSRLGSAEERVVETTAAGLAAGRFDPDSVVVILGPGSLPLVGWTAGSGDRWPPSAGAMPPVSSTVLAWGLPDSAFPHPPGFLAKPEVRSVVLGKLALPASGVLWDVGVDAGVVGIECALLRPGLSVLAVKPTPSDSARVSGNAVSLGAGVHVVADRNLGTFDDLPAPDRVFVGGGRPALLHAVVERLRPGGRVVAAYASLDDAVAAADRLDNVVQIGIARGERAPQGGWRLAARDPVFVAWGPGVSTPDAPPAGADLSDQAG
ncbi:MAG: precorrin-6y C5,15-methyltransferase (decarboxylating) subunit CbiE [Acidimicrobiales bacterium]